MGPRDARAHFLAPADVGHLSNGTITP